MEKDKIETLLDAFFSDELNSSEKEDFLNELETNKELKKAFQFEKRIKENAIKLNSKDFEKNIQTVHSNYSNTNKNTKVMKLKTILSVAASLIVVIAAYFLLNKDVKDQVDQQENYIAYLTHYETNSLGKYALRGGESDIKTMRDTLALALHESANGTVEKAKSILQELYKKYPDNEEIQLYLAIQHFKSSNYGPAIKMLANLTKSSDKSIKEEAEMAMAMATTSLNDNNETAISWFKKIAKNNTHKHKEMAEMQLSFYE